jgi:hypothetical protein
MELDMKSLIFIIVFAIAGGLVLLGCYAIAYEGASITSMKTGMDFAFAAVLAVMAVVQYKILETTEKA